jgi:hypothetical protein
MGTIQIDGSTPKLTIGNATAEDALIVFDGNAQDFYIGLDDSADDLVIGLGSATGTTPAISINEDRDVTISDGAIDFDVASHDTSNGLKLGGTLVTATAAELNIMDGVTSTAAEINLIDGGTARGTTALADGDGVLINDGGTMRMTNVTAVKTYMASDFAASDITGATDYGNTPAATGDSLIMHDTSASALREITISNLGNTPAVYTTADATAVADSTWTKVEYGTDTFDTHSAFSSHKFTVPSGCAGLYCVTWNVGGWNMTDQERMQTSIYKNGSAVDQGDFARQLISYASAIGASVENTCLLDLDASDYIEVYVWQNSGGSVNTASNLRLGIFRITGVE